MKTNKITPETAKEIRKLYATGEYSIKELSLRFRYQCVYRLLLGLLWKTNDGLQEKIDRVLRARAQTVAVLVLFACALAHGQQISPPVSEYGKKANGSFTMRNNRVQAEIVTVQPMSFTPGADKPTLRPLDATAHVELSEMSARVQAQQEHEFTYRIRCDAYPCNVMFLVGIMAGKTADGIGVRLVLTHAAYVCEKAKGCRAGILRAAGVEVKK